MSVFEMPGTDDEKRAYALALIECNGDAYKAGFKIFGENNRALGAGACWPRDPLVIEIMAAAAVDKINNREGLPTKEELGRKLIEIADAIIPGSDMPLYDAKDRLKALDQYADIMGFKPKPEPVTVNNNNVALAKVVVVKDFGNDNTFEAKAMAQQEKLIRDSAADI